MYYLHSGSLFITKASTRIKKAATISGRRLSAVHMHDLRFWRRNTPVHKGYLGSQDCLCSSSRATCSRVVIKGNVGWKQVVHVHLLWNLKVGCPHAFAQAWSRD